MLDPGSCTIAALEFLDTVLGKNEKVTDFNLTPEKMEKLISAIKNGMHCCMANSMRFNDTYSIEFHMYMVANHCMK